MRSEKRANHWILPLSQLAIETAARQSELLALKWCDIDLDRLSIRFQGKERADGKRRLKNKTKFRDVPISRSAKTLLEAIPRTSKEKDAKVFPTTASAVKQSFARATIRAGIENLHFHDLRHEGTSRLASIYDMHKLMKITGHEDTRMLARYYHPKVEDLVTELWDKTAQEVTKTDKSHEEATLETFRKNPELLAEYIDSVLADGDNADLVLALKSLKIARTA